MRRTDISGISTWQGADPDSSRNTFLQGEVISAVEAEFTVNRNNPLVWDMFTKFGTPSCACQDGKSAFMLGPVSIVLKQMFLGLVSIVLVGIVRTYC